MLRFHGEAVPVPWTLGRYRPDSSVVFERPANGAVLLKMGGAHIMTVSGEDIWEQMTTVEVYDLEGEPVDSYTYGPAYLNMIRDFAVTSRDEILITGSFELWIDFGFTRVVQGDVEESQGYFLALSRPR